MTDRVIAKLDEVKSIGDAGDSKALDHPVREMLRCIRLALHCGDHQSLKVALEKLEMWKRQQEDDRFHDYWRVAQLTGEAELKNVCILLTVTSEKPDNVKWQYLQDALAVLNMCLCNREIISTWLSYACDIQPVLAMALDQDCNEEGCLEEALLIMRKMLIVCGERFAKLILTNSVLDPLTERVHQWLLASPKLVSMLLEVFKSLLMCGQDQTFDYAVRLIKRLSDTLSQGDTNSDTDENQLCGMQELCKFYEALVKSIEFDTNSLECATFWTRGKSTKDLLRECLEQPWLFIYCSWPPCGMHNGMPQTFFRKCAACSTVRYCSRQCQTKHWEAGHNMQCKALINRNQQEK